MNTSLSKSEAKATGCAYYYRKYYVEKLPQHQMPWTTTGTEFHDFMEKYVQYLVDTRQQQDLGWVKDELACTAIGDDAAALVEGFVPKLVIEDPGAVLGLERFFVIDKDFQPLGVVEHPGVGQRPKDLDNAYAHGTLDRIEHAGGTAIKITDYKTGFLPSRVDDYEAIHYSVLAFCYYPWAETITFRWEFPRFGTSDEVTFGRDELEDMKMTMQRKIAIRDAVAAMDKPSANPLAGLCGYCDIECPVRYPVTGTTRRVFHPIQNDDDARAAAGTLTAIRSARAVIESQLKNYLGQRGPVDLQNGNQAHMATTFSPVLQLRTVLAILGVDVPEKSPEFDVPLDSLFVNNSELARFAKAKKRDGLLETVTASVPTKTRVTLKLGDLAEEDQ